MARERGSGPMASLRQEPSRTRGASRRLKKTDEMGARTRRREETPRIFQKPS